VGSHGIGLKQKSSSKAPSGSKPVRNRNPPTIGDKFPTTALLALRKVPSIASFSRCAPCPH
jgi:hypothetical protein